MMRKTISILFAVAFAFCLFLLPPAVSNARAETDGRAVAVEKAALDSVNTENSVVVIKNDYARARFGTLSSKNFVTGRDCLRSCRTATNAVSQPSENTPLSLRLTSRVFFDLPPSPERFYFYRRFTPDNYFFANKDAPNKWKKFRLNFQNSSTSPNCSAKTVNWSGRFLRV